MYCKYSVFGAVDWASANQSCVLPGPFVSVTVTEPPGLAVVALTARLGPRTTAKDKAAEVPPPGAGVRTWTDAVAADVRSLDGMAACSCVELVYVVGRATPFQSTTDDAVKLLPVTVSVNP